MKRSIQLRNRQVFYTLTYKPVKNINLRIKSDGSIFLSAPKRISEEQLEQFLVSKSDWILKSLEKFRRQRENSKQIFPVTELDESVILKIFDEVYEQFQSLLSQKPALVIRTMKSRWGSCHPQKYKITINRHLLKFSEGCIRYVMVHEFVHFLHPNHSKAFYTTLGSYLPDYQKYRNLLKLQNII